VWINHLAKEDRVHQHASSCVPVATKAGIVGKEHHMARADALAQSVCRERQLLFVLRADEATQLEIIFYKVGRVLAFGSEFQNGSSAIEHRHLIRQAEAEWMRIIDIYTQHGARNELAAEVLLAFAILHQLALELCLIL